MKKIQFLKEPGYVYDLYFLFGLYFNKEKTIGMKVLPEDDVYYNGLLEKFGEVPEDLRLFFYLNDRMFMTVKYYDHYDERFVEGGYTLPTVLEQLGNVEQVIENVIQFYFKNIDSEQLELCKNSLPVISRLIKESEYSIEVKNSLYSFFIEPVSIIQSLILQLSAKEVLMRQMYVDNEEKLYSIQNNFDYHIFLEKVMKIKPKLADTQLYDQVIISFCLNCKNTFHWVFGRNQILFVMGIDYINTIEFIKRKANSFRIDVFGSVVSEENRLEMLDLMQEMGEVTIKDIETKLGMTGANAYYHLMLMIKAGMLKTRNIGRTIFYGINYKYFTNLKVALSKYEE